MKKAKEDRLYFRIFDFSQEYEVKGFQDRLNREAYDYLKKRGVESIIMPAPQGAGAGAMEGVTLVVKLLSLLVKVFPFVGRYIHLIHEKRVDEAMRHFTIWLDTTSSSDTKDRTDLSEKNLIIGYDLKLHLENIYPNYIFKIQTTVQHCSDDAALQLYVNKLRPRKSDIGRLLKMMDKRITGRHSIEYITLLGNSRIKYSFYDR